MTVDKVIVIKSDAIITIAEDVETFNLDFAFELTSNGYIIAEVNSRESFESAFNYASEIKLTENLIPSQEEINADNYVMTFIAENRSFDVTIDLNGHNLGYNLVFTNIYAEELATNHKMTIKVKNSVKGTTASDKKYIGYSNDPSNIAIYVNGNENFNIYFPLQVLASFVSVNGTYLAEEGKGQIIITE